MNARASLMESRPEIAAAIGKDLDNKRTVAVSGLPETAEWEDVAWAMDYCGQVVYQEMLTDASLGTSTCVVTFSSPEEAQAALLMSGMENNDCTLKVSTVRIKMAPVTMKEGVQEVYTQLHPLFKPDEALSFKRQETPLMRREEARKARAALRKRQNKEQDKALAGILQRALGPLGKSDSMNAVAGLALAFAGTVFTFL
ncbi:hypothetical protein DIPPA_32598 [Diplonema papillatum]|nr:hypothetical protein DIPPA_32598 [Diplonema papillatum]